MTYRVRKGFVYLVGAGPGDPGLLSIKAKSILEQADVVIYDNLVNQKVLNWLKPEARSIFVGKSSGQHSIPQAEINALLIEEAQNDVSIVRLKGGDPLVFGRAGEEVDALDSEGIHYEIVPGITAAIACAAYAGIQISQRDISSSIIFLTGHENPEKTSLNLDFKEYAKSNSTLCIYMGIGQLKRIVGELLEGGLKQDTPVAIVENGTYVKQRSCFSTLGQIIPDSEAMEIKSPAIVFVGNVVKSRSQYNWFEEKPLFGKKILVPRPRKQAGELSQLLENYGADVLEVPFIEIEEDYDRDSITNVFTDIASYEWIVFTSANGVDLFFDLLDKAYEDVRSIGLSQIATVGKATARAVRNHKLKVSLIPETANSNALAEALIEHQTLDNVKILLVTGDKNSDILFKRLQDEGRAIVDRLPLYKNVRTDLSKNENFERFKEEGADLVLFTSSSTVHNYISATQSLELSDSIKPKFGSIGVKTSESLRKHNLPVAFESSKANLENFVVETLSYFRNPNQ
jgi:uroporphyrinogen III methyltransferase/synthase